MGSASRAPECSKCGAPLGDSSLEGGASLRCRYCGAIHRFTPAPPPGTAPVELAVGSAVLVRWGERWWNGHVERIVSEAQWEISYDGWASNWNEVVGPDRLAALRSGPQTRVVHANIQSPRSPTLPCVLGGLVLLLIGLGVSIAAAPRRGESSLSSSSAARTGGALVVGSDVEVLWQGTWYKAQVLRPVTDGRVRVHYVGWSSSWDEDVTLDRVRQGR